MEELLTEGSWWDMDVYSSRFDNLLMIPIMLFSRSARVRVHIIGCGIRVESKVQNADIYGMH